MKTLLQRIWIAEAQANPPTRTACRFQTGIGDSIAEIYACSRCVYYDYAPRGRMDLNKYEPVGDIPLRPLDDPTKVLAENMFYSNSVLLEDNSLLRALFLNDGPGRMNKELSAFDLNGTAAYYNRGLSWKDAPQFEWVRKVFYRIPLAVCGLVENAVTLKELNAQLVRLKTSPDMALLLGSATSWLLVTMSQIKPEEDVNDHIFIGGVQHRLDGWNNETQVFTRLVEVVDKDMRGLPNPTKAVKEQIVEEPVAPVAVENQQPEEPQVEDVQPDAAEEIAEAAAEEPVQEAALLPQEESKKRTRTRKAPTAATPANAKALDDVIAYMGSPVADSMTVEEIDEEVRKCRDLGIALSRRLANLYAAGTLIPKKKLAAVRDAVI